MKRIMLKELNFASRNEGIRFLKKLWNQEKTSCPICGNELELLHKKAKKSDCDWKCPACGEIYRTIGMLKDLPEQ